MNLFRLLDTIALLPWKQNDDCRPDYKEYTVDILEQAKILLPDYYVEAVEHILILDKEESDNFFILLHNAPAIKIKFFPVKERAYVFGMKRPVLSDGHVRTWEISSEGHLVKQDSRRSHPFDNPFRIVLAR